MKPKKPTRSRARKKASRGIVINPRQSELRWLDDLPANDRSAESKAADQVVVAGAKPAEHPVQAEKPASGSGDERARERTLSESRLTTSSVSTDKPQQEVKQQEAASGKPSAGTQCGTVPFRLTAGMESCTVEIPLKEPFPDSGYVLVAMTDHPACYPALKEQARDRAFVELARTKTAEEISGTINWIVTIQD